MYTINETISFNGRGIHVRYDGRNAVGWICLKDICRELKRSGKSDIENYAAFCKDKQKYPIYTNGALFWFVSKSDVYAILNKVRKENKIVAGVCDELLKWLGQLPAGKPEDVTPYLSDRMDENSNGQAAGQPAGTADTKDFPVRGVVLLEKHIPYFESNGRTYHNASLMGREFGISPKAWLQKAETLRFRNALVRQGLFSNTGEQLLTKRGQCGVTFFEYHLALEFARYLDPDIAVKNNLVMSKLGKYGIVVADEKETCPPGPLSPEDKINHLVANSQFKLPQTRSEAFMLLAELAKQIEENRPKVEYYNRMIENRENFTTYFIASELDVSVVHLYKFLVDERIVKYEKRTYVVYPSYQALQCDKDYLFTFKNGKTYICGKGKRWTHAGREFIIDLYKRKQNQNTIIIG